MALRLAVSAASPSARRSPSVVEALRSLAGGFLSVHPGEGEGRRALDALDRTNDRVVASLWARRLL